MHLSPPTGARRIDLFARDTRWTSGSGPRGNGFVCHRGLIDCGQNAVGAKRADGTAHAAWRDNNGTAIQSTTSGLKDDHGDQGTRKIARIGDVIVVTTTGTGANNGTDHCLRSINNGLTWTQIAFLTYARRGTILSGPDNTFHAFWVRTGGTTGVYHTTWKADSTSPPAPSLIWNGNTLSESDGAHQHITATINESGHLFVAWHDGHEGSSTRDQIYIIRSTDGGATWSSPLPLTSGTNGYILPDLMVDHSNIVHIIYADDWASPPATNDRRVYYRRSTDGGETWSTAVPIDSSSTTGASLSNINILESKNNNLFVFGQRYNTPNPGLVFSRSTNGGTTWSAFSLVDHSNTMGYADPSAAVGSDGTIYTVSRNDKYADGTTITCNQAPCWTNVVNMSMDEGMTWRRAETNRINNTRIWTSNSIRYQTWWNYGGPLEWVWHQGVDTSNQATYYDANPEVMIFHFERVRRIPVSPIITGVTLPP